MTTTMILIYSSRSVQLWSGYQLINISSVPFTWQNFGFIYIFGIIGVGFSYCWLNQHSPGIHSPSHYQGRNHSFSGKYPPQATSHSYSLRSTQAGQASNTTRASRQGNRCPPTIGQLRLPRRSTLPPRKVTPPSPPQ